MWDLLFRNLVLRLVVLLCVILLFPVILVITTPVLLIVAGFLAWRGRQTFRSAVGEMYAGAWEGFCDIVGALFGHRFR
jgi:hypothetical protein